MIYKDFKGKTLSALGLGTMRFPVIDGDTSKIDEKKTFEIFDYAISHGINYFDTAWGYHNGMSETVVGKALKRYPRESFFLASKFPGYDTNNFGKTKEIFEKQLEKCQVDYFDFYLIHNVCEKNIDYYLNDSYGTLKDVLEQKKLGKIKHLGFSTHADFNNFVRFMDKYGEHMEFCQIQLNYIDYEFQEAKKKIDYLNERAIPVFVMEPLRGGKLATVDPIYLKTIFEMRADETVCSIAFRFLQSLDGICVTLSGMSNLEQVADNIKTFSEHKPLNNSEFSELLNIAKHMTSSVPCTSCKYCMEYCPQGLDIPKLIGLYNELKFSNGGFLAPMYVSTLTDDKKPSACIGCGACEAVCPQNISIPDIMSDFSSKLKR